MRSTNTKIRTPLFSVAAGVVLSVLVGACSTVFEEPLASAGSSQVGEQPNWTSFPIREVTFESKPCTGRTPYDAVRFKIRTSLVTEVDYHVQINVRYMTEAGGDVESNIPLYFDGKMSALKDHPPLYLNAGERLSRASLWVVHDDYAEKHRDDRDLVLFETDHRWCAVPGAVCTPKRDDGQPYRSCGKAADGSDRNVRYTCDEDGQWTAPFGCPQGCISMAEHGEPGHDRCDDRAPPTTAPPPVTPSPPVPNGPSCGKVALDANQLRASRGESPLTALCDQPGSGTEADGVCHPGGKQVGRATYDCAGGCCYIAGPDGYVKAFSGWE